MLRFNLNARQITPISVLQKMLAMVQKGVVTPKLSVSTHRQVNFIIHTFFSEVLRIFFILTDLQISMSVLPTHVKMVAFALMESMDTHVTVLLDTLVSTVKQVS